MLQRLGGAGSSGADAEHLRGQPPAMAERQERLAQRHAAQHAADLDCPAAPAAPPRGV